MRILVTGGAGFIGSTLVRWLIGRGHQVRVLDNLSTGRRENLAPLGPALELVRGDIRDRPLLAQAIEGAEVVFHLAAMISVSQSVEQPLEALDINVAGTVGLLEAARHAGVRRVVQASTCAVYGDSASLPIGEGERPMPMSPYAATKLSAEQFGQLYTSLYGLEVVALRFFNVYGPGQDPMSPYAAAIPRFLSMLSEGRPITIFGDGEQSRDFVYVEDIVRALWAASEAPGVGGEVFNVGSGRATSVRRLAESLGSIMGREVELQFVPARPGEVRHSCSDISRLHERTGYLPLTDLSQGLRLTAAPYLARLQ